MLLGNIVTRDKTCEESRKGNALHYNLKSKGVVCKTRVLIVAERWSEEYRMKRKQAVNVIYA